MWEGVYIKNGRVLNITSCHGNLFVFAFFWGEKKVPNVLCQRRKKRKFYGNRFTNKQRVDKKEREVTESTSSRSKGHSSHDQKEAKEFSPYRKLQSDTQQEKPQPKLDEKEKKGNRPAITGLRFCDMEVLSSVFSQLRCGECGSSHFPI